MSIMANTLQAQQARKSPGLIPISQQKLAQRKLRQAQQAQYKEPTQEEIDAYVAQEVEKAKIANEKAINETINIWEGRLEFYRKRRLQLEENGLSKNEKEEYNNLDDRMGEVRLEIEKLNEAKNKGLSSGDAFNYASNATTAYRERMEARKKNIEPQKKITLSSSGYSKEAGGYYDAFTGKFYSTSNKQFVPKEVKEREAQEALSIQQIKAIEGSTYQETFTGTSIEPYKDTQVNKQLQDIWGTNTKTKGYGTAFSTTSSSAWANIKQSFEEIYGVNKGGKTETQLFREITKPTTNSTLFNNQGTVSYNAPSYESLSKEAKLFSFSVNRQLGVDASIQSKEQKIMDIISPGGITEAEATAANIALTNISKSEYSKISSDITKEQKRIIEAGALKIGSWKAPEWKADLNKQEDWLYSKGVSPKLIKLGLATESFGVGAWEGIRTQPKKALTTAAITVGVGALTYGLGAGATAAGYTTAAARIGTGAKIFGYGAGTIYGGSVAARVLFTPSLYGKTRVAGEITSTELLPGYLGYKFSKYGIRRGELAYDRYRVLKGESELLGKYKFSQSELNKIKQQYKLSKAFQNVKTPVKELSFEGMKRIPKAAQEPLMKFLQTYKRSQVLGGSLGGQRTQLITPERRAPGDVDIFVQGRFAGLKSWLRARSLSRKLSAAGVKNKFTGDFTFKQLMQPKKGLFEFLKTKTGKAAIKIGGEKTVEFHPYKDFLGANIEQVIPLYRTSKMGITRTPSGIRVLKLGVQGSQKVLGYARYGKPRTKDILDWEKAIRPSLEKQIVTELGPKLKYVDYIKAPGIEKGLKIMGQVTRTPILNRVKKVEILTTAEPKTLTHELVHVKKPFWSERKVGEATVMSALADKNGFYIYRKTSLVSRENIVQRTNKYYFKFPSQSKLPFYNPYQERKIKLDYKPLKTKVKQSKPYKPMKIVTPKIIIPIIEKPYKPQKNKINNIIKPHQSKPYKPMKPTTDIIITPTKYQPYEPTKPTKSKVISLKFKGRKLFKPQPRRRLLPGYKYVPSIAATILRITSTKKPTTVTNEGYFAGLRPQILPKPKNERFKRARII